MKLNFTICLILALVFGYGCSNKLNRTYQLVDRPTKHHISLVIDSIAERKYKVYTLHIAYAGGARISYFGAKRKAGDRIEGYLKRFWY